MLTEKRIEELGYQLPPESVSPHPYNNVVIYNNIAYISGTIAKINGRQMMNGRVPDEISIEDAQKCCAQTVLQALGNLKAVIGDLDRIEQVLRVTGYVYCEPGFDQEPVVMNGCSNMLREIFGDKGRHARSAVGMAGMPNGTPVEIEFTIALKDETRFKA